MPLRCCFASWKEPLKDTCVLGPEATASSTEISASFSELLGESNSPVLQQTSESKENYGDVGRTNLQYSSNASFSKIYVWQILAVIDMSLSNGPQKTIRGTRADTEGAPLAQLGQVTATGIGILRGLWDTVGKCGKLGPV